MNKIFIIKSVVRVLGIISIAIVIPLAASNTMIVQGHWIVYLFGVILALNIVMNEPNNEQS